VRIDPSREAAESVSGKIAAALAGKARNGQSPKRPPEDIEGIVRSLVERLTQQGVKACEIGAFVSQLAANRPAGAGDPPWARSCQ
jgi:hypothetical protein